MAARRLAKHRRSKFLTPLQKHPEIKGYTFQEARRKKNLYQALFAEFNEANCLYCASRFRHLVEKECKMFQEETILSKVCDDESLLLTLFEHAMKAELLYTKQSYDGVCSSINTLYQALKYLEAHGGTGIYNWLLWDLYVIVTKLCRRIKWQANESCEQVARIYYNFGSQIINKNRSLSDAITLLDDARKICFGQNWLSDDLIGFEYGVHSTMSEQIVKKLSQVLVTQAEEVLLEEPEAALKLVKYAIHICALNGETAILDQTKAELALVKIKIEMGRYEIALEYSSKIEKYLKTQQGNIAEKLLCINYGYQGCAYTWLQNSELAISHLTLAENLAVKHKMRSEEAYVFLHLGYTLFKMDNQKATNYMDLAIKIFGELNDMTGQKRAKYLKARLQLDLRFSQLKLLIRDSNSNFNRKFALQKWKFLNEPFPYELDDMKEQQANDNIHCLLKEFPEPIIFNLGKMRKPTLEETVRKRLSTQIRRSRMSRVHLS